MATQRNPLPADLAAVVAAWDKLPDALRAGIVAMVKDIGFEVESSPDAPQMQGMGHGEDVAFLFRPV